MLLNISLSDYQIIEVAVFGCYIAFFNELNFLIVKQFCFMSSCLNNFNSKKITLEYIINLFMLRKR